MNDMNVATDNNAESTEADDFVVLGKVTEETKGLVGASWFDGNGGWWG